MKKIWGDCGVAGLCGTLVLSPPTGAKMKQLLFTKEKAIHQNVDPTEASDC